MSGLCVAVLLGVGLYYQIPPPVVVYGLVLPCYGIAAGLPAREAV
jgi:hypothetical protein